MASCRDTRASPCLPPTEYTVDELNEVKNTASFVLCSLSLIFFEAIIKDEVRTCDCLMSAFDGILRDSMLGFEQFQLYEIGAIP